MSSIARIDDLETCKKVAMSLERECEKLIARNEELLRENAQLRGTQAEHALLEEIERLQQQAAQLQRIVFGVSSERRPQEDVPAPEAPKPPRKGHGPRAQPALPVREVVHELPESQRSCPKCQGELKAWVGQTEDAELVSLIRRGYELVNHRRQKYLCACPDRAIVTAPGPPRLIEGGRYSVEFGVEVALDKHLNHLPLDRQRKMMQREGLIIDTQTLWNQLEAVSAIVHPAYEKLGEWILSQPLIHADETHWPLIKSPQAERWQAWSIASEDAVFHKILPSRSAEAGARLLGGYRGVAMVDGYEVYACIARAGPGLSLAHCWAHVRRKYVEIESSYPEECKVILGLIGKLYAIDKKVPLRPHAPAAERATDLARRAVLRDAESRAVTAEILTWAQGLRLTPRSALRRAVEYMTGRWAGLTRFLDDPRVPLDNNLLERALRPLALGRKNFLGSRSELGVVCASVLYSLIETAKLVGVDPRKYLLAAVHAGLEVPHRIVLPHELRG